MDAIRLLIAEGENRRAKLPRKKQGFLPETVIFKIPASIEGFTTKSLKNGKIFPFKGKDFGTFVKNSSIFG